MKQYLLNMKLKVCGLKDAANINDVMNLNVDYIGFIFYKNSPRYFKDALTFDEVRKIPKHIKKVGVFVNEDLYKIFNAIAHYDLDVVQLHGNETVNQCVELKPYVQVIKAFGIHPNFDFDLLDQYKNSVDYFLFDTASSDHGGSGKTFDHTLLQNYKLQIPFFLSGGISLENLEEVRNFYHPKLIGYDINSKFETEPGIKNILKIKQFMTQLDHENTAK